MFISFWATQACITPIIAPKDEMMPPQWWRRMTNGGREGEDIDDIVAVVEATDLANASKLHGPPYQEIMGQVNQVAHMNFLAGTNSPFSINQTKHIHLHIMHL